MVEIPVYRRIPLECPLNNPQSIFYYLYTYILFTAIASGLLSSMPVGKLFKNSDGVRPTTRILNASKILDFQQMVLTVCVRYFHRFIADQ